MCITKGRKNESDTGSIADDSAEPLSVREKLFAPEELEELAASIREYGVPAKLPVRRRGQKFDLIAGERRFRAAGLAGLAKVPVIMKELENRSRL